MPELTLKQREENARFARETHFAAKAVAEAAYDAHSTAAYRRRNAMLAQLLPDANAEHQKGDADGD